MISAHTKVLTDQGFVPFTALNIDLHRIACVDLDTDTFTFEPFKWLQQIKYSGEVISFNGRAISLLVTPDHPMVFKYRGNEEWSSWCINEAQAIEDRTVKLQKTLPFRGPYLGLDTKWEGVLDSDFLKFVGFWCGDGGRHATTKNIGTVFAAKDRKLEWLESLSTLELEFVPLHKPDRNLVMNEIKARLPEIGQWLHHNCVEGKEKTLPGWFVQLLPEQVDNVFEGLRNSDGFLTSYSWAYCTTSIYLANMIFAMAVAHGMNVSVTERPPGRGRQRLYTVNFLTSDPTFMIDHSPSKRTKYDVALSVNNAEMAKISVPAPAIIVADDFKAVVVGVDE